MRLRDGDGGERVAPVKASDDTVELGPQDAIVVAVKTTSAASVAAGIAPLLRPGGTVVFAANGIPWWYGMNLNRQAGKAAAPDLSFLDPGGRLASQLYGQTLLGCVVHAAAAVGEPGVIINTTAGANRLVLGQPNGRAEPGALEVAAMLAQAGFDAPLVGNIREAVWQKLVYNLCQNSICGVVEQPLSVIGNSPALLRLAKAIMSEGLAVASAHGIDVKLDPETAFGPRQIAAPHKPSLLQDLQRHRPVEIDALFVAVQAFARAAAIPTPHLDTVTALLTQRAIDAGSYPPLPG